MGVSSEKDCSEENFPADVSPRHNPKGGARFRMRGVVLMNGDSKIDLRLRFFGCSDRPFRYTVDDTAQMFGLSPVRGSIYVYIEFRTLDELKSFAQSNARGSGSRMYAGINQGCYLHVGIQIPFDEGLLESLEQDKRIIRVLSV